MSDHRADARCRRIAASQFGLLERTQALAAGLSNEGVRRRVLAGQLERVYPTVYLYAGHPRSYEQGVEAGLLWLGRDGAASGPTAARLWEIDGFRHAGLEFSVPRFAKPMHGQGRVRIIRTLTAEDVVEHRGLRVTSPARTLLDLAATLTPLRLEKAIDSALRRSLTDLAELHLLLRRRRGRRGIRMFRDVVERRYVTGATDSGLEVEFASILSESRIPLPVFQHRCVERGTVVCVIDFAYPELDIAIEIDSYGFHTSPSEFERDRTRQNYLVNRGWLLLRFTEFDIRSRRGYVARTVLEAREGRLAARP